MTGGNSKCFYLLLSAEWSDFTLQTARLCQKLEAASCLFYAWAWKQFVVGWRQTDATLICAAAGPQPAEEREKESSFPGELCCSSLRVDTWVIHIHLLSLRRANSVPRALSLTPFLALHRWPGLQDHKLHSQRESARQCRCAGCHLTAHSARCIRHQRTMSCSVKRVLMINTVHLA